MSRSMLVDININYCSKLVGWLFSVRRLTFVGDGKRYHDHIILQDPDQEV